MVEYSDEELEPDGGYQTGIYITKGTENITHKNGGKIKCRAGK
jgi:hypothetical protein